MLKCLFKKLVVFGFLTAVVAGLSPAGSAEATSAFKDVQAKHWAKKAIDAAVAKGYFKGYSDGSFRPNAPISRAEFATLMARVSKNEVVEGRGSFADLNGHWSEPEVKKAIGMGYLSPDDYPDGLMPGNPITRVELAKWMSTGLAAKSDDFKQALSDTKDTLVPIAEFYKGGLKKASYPHVAVAMGTGLMAGYPDGTFGPGKTTTRAEVAIILERYIQVQEKEAASFRDLNEMREVGLTGTNLLSATPHVYNVLANSREILSFDRMANKPYKMMYNRGTMTIHRMIVVDVNFPDKPNNLYGKMFMDKEFSWPVRDSYYNVFLEATIIPSDNSSLTNAAFPSSTLYNFTSGRGFKSGTLERYGLTVLPESDDYLKTGFFKKDQTIRFWMHQYLNREWKEYDNGGEMGSYGTATSFYIPKSK